MFECFMILLPFALGAVALFGIVYPAVMVALYRLAGGKRPIKDIIGRL